jgi:hypothetical protein
LPIFIDRGAPIESIAYANRHTMHDENMHARGCLQWIDHPELDRVVLPHSPFVFEGGAAPA